MSDDVIRRLSVEGVDPLTLAGVNDANLIELSKRLGVRVSLRGDTLTLQGTSYGTFVAQQYARTYPDHVDRLVLDSVVGPDGVDPFLVDSWRALPRILTENCADNACRAITADPVGDVRRLAAKLDAAPLKGPVVDGQGRRVTERLGAVGLVSLLLAGDLNSHLRAALPAAIHSAVNGDQQYAALRMRSSLAQTHSPT